MLLEIFPKYILKILFMESYFGKEKLREEDNFLMHLLDLFSVQTSKDVIS